MIKVTKNAQTLECLGVWASPKKRVFRAVDSPSTAWGYEGEPFIPTEKQFKNPDFVKLRLNEGWSLE